MRTPADYVIAAKVAMGDRSMSDRRLGELLPRHYSTQDIQRARRGEMPDRMCLELAELLRAHGVNVHAGELLLVARAHREIRDPRVKVALLENLERQRLASLEPRGRPVLRRAEPETNH